MSAGNLELYPVVTAYDVEQALNTMDDIKTEGALYNLAQRGEVEISSHLDSVAYLLGSASSAEVKIAGCTLLRNAGVAAADYVQLLTSLLEDQEASVRYDACLTIAVLGPLALEAAATIRKLLGDQDVPVRTAACSAVGSFGDPNDVQELTKMLGDASPEVQGAACMALAKLGVAGAKSAAQVAEKLVEPRSRLPAVAAIGLMGEAASDHCTAICRCLEDDDDDVRYSAAQAVGQLAESVQQSKEASSILKDLLNHDEGKVRCAAIMALGYMGEKADDVCEEVKELLFDSFEESPTNSITAGGARSRLPATFRIVKCAAAVALGSMGSKGADYMDDVSRLLDDDNWEVRVAACDGLAAMGESAKEQASKVISLFEDGRYMVRSRAAAACGKLKDPDVAASLAELFPDKCPAVREEALLALAELGEDGEEHIEKVFEKLEDLSPVVRAAAARALGRMEKGSLYAGRVVQLLQEEAIIVRVAVIEALGLMRERGAAYMEEVAEALNDLSPEVRAAAATSLGKMGNEALDNFAADLRRLCDDPNASVAKAAKEALTKPVLDGADLE